MPSSAGLVRGPHDVGAAGQPQVSAETPSSMVHERMVQHVRERLPQPAADEAIDALDRYLADRRPAAEERDRPLGELDRVLPPEERLAQERATAPQRLRTEVEQMRAAGASDAEIFAYRERAVGKAAAERLALVDRRRVQWNDHWESYRAERARTLASSSSLPPEARDALLDSLRRKHFGEEERARARYLDQVELRDPE